MNKIKKMASFCPSDGSFNTLCGVNHGPQIIFGLIMENNGLRKRFDNLNFNRELYTKHAMLTSCCVISLRWCETNRNFGFPVFASVRSFAKLPMWDYLTEIP